MLKITTSVFLIAALFTMDVFADYENSTFDQDDIDYLISDSGSSPFQDDIDDSISDSKSSSFVIPSTLPSKINRYVGINLGIGNTLINSELTTKTTSNIPILETDPVLSTKTNYVKESTDAINYAFGAYGGIGTNFNHFYIGSELSVGGNLLNKTITVGTIEMTVKQPVVAGLDIIPGYLIQSGKILFYGRLGAGSSLTEIDVKDSNTGFNNKTNKVTFGWRAGTGFEYFISKIFSLKAEYLYVNYGSLSDNGSKDSNFYEFALKSYKDNTSYNCGLNNFGVHQINLGLAMHF